MAKLIVPNDAQLAKSLEEKVRQGRLKWDKLKDEVEVCWSFYQGIPKQNTRGGVDAEQAKALFFQNQANEDYESLDSTKPASLMLFLQSKLCISDPSVTVKPYNRDEESKQAARYASFVIEHIKETTKMQEVLESGMYLDCAVTGTGIVYHGWNADAGDVQDTKELPPDENGESQVEIKMSGDWEFRSVDTANFFIDDVSKNFNVDANWCIERRKIPIEMPLFLFPNKVKEIYAIADYDKGKEGETPEKQATSTYVYLYEYWEKRLPWNGMLGLRVVFMMKEEKVMLLSRDKNPYEHGELPYSVLTDVDVKGDPWGISRATIASFIIDVRNRFMSLVMRNIALNGSMQLIAPEGSVADDALKDGDPRRVLFYNAATGDKPSILQPGAVTSDIWRLDNILQKELDDLYGASEFSRGEIPRELSSYAVTLATETDDKFRVRVFNKKKECIKRLFSQALSYCKQYVKEPRMFKISGKEESSSYEYFQSTDLQGHYGIFVDFGMWMPVDPYARKQQVLELVNSGIFEKAGGDMKKLVSILVDGDLLDVQDLFISARRVQNEEILRMINGEESPVQPWHEHASHYQTVVEYMNSKSFETLEEDVRTRIFQHGEEHKQALAQLQAAAQGGPQQLQGSPQQSTMNQAAGAGDSAPMM